MIKAILVAGVVAVAGVSLAVAAALSSLDAFGWDTGTKGAREGEWAKAKVVPAVAVAAEKVPVEKAMPKAVAVPVAEVARREVEVLAGQLDAKLVKLGQAVLAEHGFDPEGVRQLILRSCLKPPKEDFGGNLEERLKRLIYKDKHFRRVCKCRAGRGPCFWALK